MSCSTGKVIYRRRMQKHESSTRVSPCRFFPPAFRNCITINFSIVSAHLSEVKTIRARSRYREDLSTIISVAYASMNDFDAATSRYWLGWNCVTFWSTISPKALLINKKISFGRVVENGMNFFQREHPSDEMKNYRWSIFIYFRSNIVYNI